MIPKLEFTPNAWSEEYREEAFKIFGNYFDTKYLIGEIDKTSFQEITFKNSPQKVELKIV